MHSKIDRQLERMTPDDAGQALSEAGVAYLPIGPLEWHGRHLPVGVDLTIALRLCLHAAERTGGVVLPPLSIGVGGEHGGYPFTALSPARDLDPVLADLVRRVLGWPGVRLVVLFCGHFAEEQKQQLERLNRCAASVANVVLALSPADCPDPGIPLDHAGRFETGLMLAWASEQVHKDRLPTETAWPIEEGESAWSDTRHDPAHPLYGVFGGDPRRASREEGRALAERLTTWLAGRVRARLDRLCDH